MFAQEEVIMVRLGNLYPNLVAKLVLSEVTTYKFKGRGSGN